MLLPVASRSAFRPGVQVWAPARPPTMLRNSASSGTLCSRAASCSIFFLALVDADVLFPDDLAPFRRLGPDQLAELFRGAGDDIRALQRELLLHVLRGEDVRERAVETLDNRARRACRRDHPDPGVGLEARIVFGDRRQVGELRAAFAAAGGKADELARLHVLPDRPARLDQHHL